MASAFDAASSGNDVVSSAASNSTTVAHGALTDGLVLIQVGVTDDFGPSSISSVTVDGSATGVTLVGSAGTNGAKRAWWYRKVLGTKSAGTMTVEATMANSPEGNICIEATTYTGVDQTTPITGFNSAQGNSTAPTVNITSVSGDLVAVGLLWKSNTNGDTITPGTNETQRYVGDGFATMAMYGGTEAATGASTTVNQTISAVREWVILGGVIAAAGGGGRPTKNTRTAPLGVEVGMNWRGNP